MQILSILTLLLLSVSLPDDLSHIYVEQFTDDIELGIDILTYLGGDDDDRKSSIAVDNEDNIYITGYTNSSDFPVLNPYDDTLDSIDAFVAKFSSSGELIYSTLIGGSSTDWPSAIKVDELGNVYIAGKTYSQDFPIVNAYDSSIEPGNPPFTYGQEAFILKLNSTGNGIIFSSYLGGSDADEITDLAIDLEKNIYVVGYTESPDFPITQNAFDKSFEHITEGFVTKLSSSGQSLLYSSFVGGDKNDFCNAIALDSSNNMYITGTTLSPEFHTKNAYSTAFSYDRFSCFVLKLSASGTLDYSTHIGGQSAEWPGGEHGTDITVDSSGNAYVSGQTSSEDFPLVNEFVDTVAVNNGGFIVKLNPSGNDLVYSSYIEGDYSTNLVVNNLGEVSLLGVTGSRDFVAIGGDSTFGGGSGDGIIYLLSTNGTPVYSSYFGGNENDILSDVVLDSSGRILIVGYTRSTDLPFENAYDETYNGDPFDVFLLVLSRDGSIEPSPTAGTISLTLDVMLLIGGIGISSAIVILVLIRKRSPTT